MLRRRCGARRPDPKESNMANNPTLQVLSTTTVANGATIYSNSYSGDKETGFSYAFIQLSGTSSVTVTQQGSLDNTTFYDVVSSAGSALGAILTTGTSTAGIFVQFDPVFAPYKRLKIVAGAASTVAITLGISEQR